MKNCTENHLSTNAINRAVATLAAVAIALGASVFAPASAAAADKPSPAVEKLRAKCEKAIRRAYPDKDDPTRHSEETDLAGIVEWNDVPEAEKIATLEQKLDRLEKLLYRDSDADGDGLADYPDDPLPAIALSPLYWTVEEMSLRWAPDALRAAAATGDPLEECFAERPVRLEFIGSCKVTLFDRAMWQCERPGRASAASVHPSFIRRAGGGSAGANDLLRAFSIFGSGDIGWNALSAQRAAQAHEVARRVAAATDGAAHTELRFKMRFVNLALSPMRCRSLEVPVEVGGREIGIAKPADPSVMELGFTVPPNDPRGTVVEFRIRLDARKLSRAWLAAPEPAAPHVAFEMCRGRIDASSAEGSIDVTRILRSIAASTVPFEVDGGDGTRLVWRVAPKVFDRTVRVTDVFAALNGVALGLAGDGHPILAGKAGWPRSLASWDNGSYGLWWHPHVGGGEVGGVDWTTMPVKGGVSFSRSASMPRLAPAVSRATGDDVADPGIDFLRASLAFEAGEAGEAYLLFQRSAEEGFAPALTWVGYMLLTEGGDHDGAAECFRKAAALGYAPGATWLGTVSKGGAAEFFRSAADAGQAEAQTRLALIVAHGRSQDRAIEAEALLRAAALQDYPTSQVSLGKFLATSGGDDGDAEAVYWFRNAARNGSPSGMTLLGTALLEGHGVARDAKAGADWLAKAAAKNYAPAQVEFGKCKFNGAGVKKDVKKAAEFFGKAAAEGSHEGEFWYGLCLLRGAGVGPDALHGLAMISSAAEGGFAPAQFLDGTLALGNTPAAPADPEKAARRFRQAAEKGIPQAQAWLGYCLANGIGVEVDLAAAREWFDKAAAQGVDVSGYTGEVK